MNRRLSDRALALLRFFMGGNAVIAWHNAISDPGSRMYKVALDADGAALVWLMAGFGLIVCLDVLINDILPDRFHWRPALKNRHFVLCALAFCYVAQLYVGVMGRQVVSLLIYYLWNAGMIMLATFLDAKLRSRNPPCGMSYS